MLLMFVLLAIYKVTTISSLPAVVLSVKVIAETIHW